MSKSENFQDKELDYWLKIDLKEGFPSGKIKVDLLVKHDAVIVNHKNEYKQVLLNLISNAKSLTLQPKKNIQALGFICPR